MAFVLNKIHWLCVPIYCCKMGFNFELNTLNMWQGTLTLNGEECRDVKILTSFVGYLLRWCMAIPNAIKETVILIIINTSTTFDIQKKDGYL